MTTKVTAQRPQAACRLLPPRLLLLQQLPPLLSSRLVIPCACDGRGYACMLWQCPDDARRIDMHMCCDFTIAHDACSHRIVAFATTLARKPSTITSALRKSGNTPAVLGPGK